MNVVGEANARDRETRTGEDGAVWADLAESGDLARFAAAWLALASRSFAAAERSALLMGEAGAFTPVARWARGFGDDDFGHFRARFDAVLEAALRTRRPALEGVGDPSGVALGFPLVLGDAVRGVMLIEAAALDAAGARRLVRHAQWSAGWLEAFLRRADASAAAGLASRAALALETVEALVDAPSLFGAGLALAGALERRLGCEYVVICRSRAHRAQVLAAAQTALLSRKSEAARRFAEAADEALDQMSALVAPGDPEAPFITFANDRLSLAHDGAHVLTCPLVVEGEPFGAAVLLRKTRAFTQDEVDVVELLCGAAAKLLRDREQGERSLPALAAARALTGAKGVFGARHLGLKAGLLGAALGLAALVLVPADYRVRARAEVQGEQRLALTAPFDGYVKAAHARAGDVVRQGDIVAELQDNEIALDRLRNASRRTQYQAELDKALAKGDLGAANVARAEVAQAEADIALSDAMRARATIKAPFDAVVVSGDLSQSIGRPVSRGDNLFEIAPLDRYRVRALIPETDVRAVEVGLTGELLLSALPERTYTVRVVSTTPIAHAVDGVNGFDAFATIDTPDARVRPGMDGVAKIFAGRRPLGWVWGHSFFEWARLKLWGVLP